MLIIVSQDQAELYRSLKPTQEASGRDRMILDRRVAARRRRRAALRLPDRRVGDRRAPVEDAERALMTVLGFTVIQRDQAAHQEARAAERPNVTVLKPGLRRPGTRQTGRQRPRRSAAGG